MDGAGPNASSHASVNPSNTNTMSSGANTFTPGAGRDMAWEWGEKRDPTKNQNVWCKLCNKKLTGGITRLKQHLTHTGGQAKGCEKVTNDIQKRVLESIQEKEKIKLEKYRNKEILRSHMVDIDDDEDEDEDDDVQEVSMKKNVSKKRKFKATSNVRGPLDDMFKTDLEKTKQATMERNNPIKEMLKLRAWEKYEIWATAAGLPFNAVRDEGFQEFIYAVGDYGKGMPAPSYHNVRVTLMKKLLEDTQKFVDSFRPHWEEYGCSIMSDFWSDGKRRSLINFLVNCPLGTIFLKSVDVSEHIKNADFIVSMINEVIADVGEANIVQVTDQLSSYMFIILTILKVEKIVGRTKFWESIQVCCQVLAPLVDVVRLVDTEEKPCMGYIYDAVNRARDQIKKNVTDDRLAGRVDGMIHTRLSDQLHHPLHAGNYPAIFHGENSREIKKSREITTGLYIAIDRLVSDEDDNDKVRQELNNYIDSIGQFGSPTAIRARTKVAPYIWWRSYGVDTPLLQTFAISVLSQTCSASPCERNWSAFDNLHSKKRNCLLQQKLNDLVFIQYNTRLKRRYKAIKTNKALDPILLREVDENDDWVIPTEEELQDFVDGRDGPVWSVVQEAMGGNEQVGPSTRSKRERYRDDDDEVVEVLNEVEGLQEQVDGLVDVASDEDFSAYP